MGLIQLFWRSDNFQREYNCSFYELEEIPLEKRRNLAYGLSLIVLGAGFELLYIPYIYALIHVRRRNFCFRLMLQMALLDVVGLFGGTIISGIHSIRGDMFCSAPTLMYATFSLLGGSWIACSQTSVVLGLNRCLAFHRREKSKLFEGKWRRLWSGYPLALGGIYALFCNAGAFSSVHGAWFFDVHFDYRMDLSGKYVSTLHYVNGLAVSGLIPAMYAVFAIHYFLMAKRRLQPIPKAETALFLQTLAINALLAVSGFTYSFLQFFNIPRALTVAHIIWLLVMANPPLVYLLLNQTVRQALRNSHLNLWLRFRGFPSLGAGKVGSQRCVVSISGGKAAESTRVGALAPATVTN